VLLLVNFAAAVADARTMGPPLVCSVLLPSQKDDGRYSCFLSKQHSSQLISSFSFFPVSYFILGSRGMSGYLPNIC